MHVRDASAADLAGILEIYNDVIATSTAIYAVAQTTLEERRRWLAARVDQGFPVLVAIEDDDVLGFSSFGDWRGQWNGYRYTVEHSVHVRADRRGTGIGRQLVEALFPRAIALNKHVMIGGIDAANAASIRFHARLGFTTAGEFSEVGHKFGRWLNLLFMQRFLDERGAARPGE